MKASPPPNRTELLLLKTLWTTGRASAREVQEALPAELDWAPSTTRTYLERMAAKGMVAKEELHGVNLYRHRLGKMHVLAERMRELADTVLGVSPAPVASLFAEHGMIDEEELAELERLLDDGEAQD
jgi:predicted transcriptional regulator